MRTRRLCAVDKTNWKPTSLRRRRRIGMKRPTRPAISSISSGRRSPPRTRGGKSRSTNRFPPAVRWRLKTPNPTRELVRRVAENVRCKQAFHSTSRGLVICHAYHPESLPVGAAFYWLRDPASRPSHSKTWQDNDHLAEPAACGLPMESCNTALAARSTQVAK